MKRQTYQEILAMYKTVEESSDKFEFEGEKFSYPRYCMWSIHDDLSERKAEYRARVQSDLLEKRTEDELLNLSRKEKFRRYSKNVGLEVLASTLEAIFVPLMIGGISVRFDGLREKKEMTYRRYKAQQQQDITDIFYRPR